MFTVFKQYDAGTGNPSGVSYSQFMEAAKAGKINSVVIQGNTLSVTPADGRPMI